MSPPSLRRRWLFSAHPAPPVLAQVSIDEADEGAHILALALGTDVNFPLARCWLYLKQNRCFKVIIRFGM